MRPLEALFSGANLLAFLSLVIATLILMPWLRYFVPIALLTAVVQVAVEGPRWQMVPGYLLALILFVIWLSGVALPGRLPVNRTVAGIGIGLGGLALVVSVLLPILLPVFHFAVPTGPYAIGTTTYHWVDPSRLEIFTTDPNDHRELMAQVWYPAEARPSAPRAPYIPDADSVTPALARLFRFPGFFLSHLKYVTTDAVASAPVAAGGAPYPVLIYLSGLGGYRQANTFQIEELVSHGYVVVGLDQPGGAALVRFPDGRQVPGLSKAKMEPLTQQSVDPQPDPPVLLGRALPDGNVPYFAEDVSFTLDQLSTLNQSDPKGLLTGRLDLGRAGIFGMSLGGINAAEACLRDARLKACLIMDVLMSADVVKEGIRQPAMWITRDADTMRLERQRAGGWTEKDIAQHQTTMRAVYGGLPGAGYYLQIPKMFHLNLTDAPYWSPILPQLGLIGPIDAQRVFRIVNAYSVAFFDEHVKGRPSALLRGPAAQYPEVIFETRRPTP